MRIIKDTGKGNLRSNLFEGGVHAAFDDLKVLRRPVVRSSDVEGRSLTQVVKINLDSEVDALTVVTRVLLGNSLVQQDGTLLFGALDSQGMGHTQHGEHANEKDDNSRHIYIRCEGERERGSR